MSSQTILGIDRMEMAAKMDSHETSKITTHWICEKWPEETCAWAREFLDRKYNRRFEAVKFQVGISSELLRKFAPKSVEVVEVPGNLLLNEGIQMMLDLVLGAGGTTAYNAANSQMGVGDSATAEAATQTDLQAATNKLYKAMNATYPSRAAQTLSFQSDFTTAEANWVWNEWTIRNGATSDKNMNRKVASLGTKSTGTWTLTGQVTLA